MINFMLYVFYQIFLKSELVTISSEIYYKAKINPKCKNGEKNGNMQSLKGNLLIFLAF